MGISRDLQDLYNRQFGSKPKVPAQKDLEQLDSGFKIEGQKPENASFTGSSLIANYRGQEIWLPIKFFELDVAKFGVSELLLPYSVIKVAAKKTIIKTPLAERQGSVKEQYSVEDLDISIKGFVTGLDASGVYPIFPEEEIKLLKDLFMLNESIKLDNALTNIFIGTDHRVIIESIEFPEVEGGRKNFRPFSMKLESDTIFTLELE